MKYKCPVCGSKLRIKDVVDQVEIFEINEEGKAVGISVNPNGYTSVYCSNDDSHHIDEVLTEQVIELI